MNLRIVSPLGTPAILEHGGLLSEAPVLALRSLLPDAMVVVRLMEARGPFAPGDEFEVPNWSLTFKRS